MDICSHLRCNGAARVITSHDAQLLEAGGIRLAAQTHLRRAHWHEAVGRSVAAQCGR
jgi:hypothetical protein